MNAAPSNITVLELAELLKNQANVRLIDVREPDEYAQAAISGSDLVPLATIPERSKDWSHDEEIFIHCKAGGRSARAAQFLSDQGFKHVTNVTGGMDAWLKENLPTATS